MAKRSEWLRFFGLALLGSVLGIAVALPFVRFPTAPHPELSIRSDVHPNNPLGPLDLAWLQAATTGQKSSPTASLNIRGRVWMKEFETGNQLSYRWSRPNQTWAGAFLELLDSRPRAEKPVDWIELGFADDEKELPWKSARRLLRGGQRGCQLVGDSDPQIAPTDWLYGGRAFLAAAPPLDNSRLLTFRTQTVVLSGHSQLPCQTVGGAAYAAQSQIDKTSVQRMSDQLGDSFIRLCRLHQGRIPAHIGYAPLVLSDKEALVRHCLGCWALAVWVKQHPSPENQRVLQENLDLALQQFKKKDGPRTYLCLDKDSSLGGLGLMAMALSTQASISGHPSPIEEELAQTLLSLQLPDGHLKTMVEGPELAPEKDVNQSFYPGEAMVYMAERAPSKIWKAAFYRSLVYYRKYFREHPRAAFVPWQVMACSRVWAIDKDPQLRDFIFEMQDWVLKRQDDWDRSAPSELKGSFAGIRGKGPILPHASGTAVHLEGLIESWQVARLEKDFIRAERYRLAIVKGLRYLRQLQLDGDRDLYFIKKSDRGYFQGGLRSNLATLDIRVDNGGHAIEAFQHILQRFQASDYLESPFSNGGIEPSITK